MNIQFGSEFPIYKDKLYRQIDGVAMGGPLGPTLANFFLGHLETKLFNGIDFGPSLYIRYVDDIFAVFRMYLITILRFRRAV